ncbi:MAG: hypothetical protein AB7N76_02805 [Planctomycetota bacterium]
MPALDEGDPPTPDPRPRSARERRQEAARSSRNEERLSYAVGFGVGLLVVAAVVTVITSGQTPYRRPAGGSGLAVGLAVTVLGGVALWILLLAGRCVGERLRARSGSTEADGVVPGPRPRVAWAERGRQRAAARSSSPVTPGKPLAPGKDASQAEPAAARRPPLAPFAREQRWGERTRRVGARWQADPLANPALLVALMAVVPLGLLGGLLPLVVSLPFVLWVVDVWSMRGQRLRPRRRFRPWRALVRVFTRGVAQRCGYCNDDLDEHEADPALLRVECPGCGAGYHHSCQAELGGCGTIGCSEARERVAPTESKARA